jgi:cyclopropane fatty-acyl-phospholipid synthase-like methyltransferase
VSAREPGLDPLRSYQDLTIDEDRERTNVHYMLPARFFEVLTGGAWHTYSANLWSDIASPDPADPAQQTRAQEAKLDRFAALCELAPGRALLDVGCGWGGPLIYLSKRYGVAGQGLTLSTEQLAYARAWAAREGVDCTFHLCHWRDFAPAGPLDAVMTDEVIVHFNHLGEFFERVYGWLREDGLLVNKELHYAHPGLGHHLGPGARLISALYGGTGNYRALGEELGLAYQARFAVESVVEMAPLDYHLTAEAWRRNLKRHQAELSSLIGPERFREYVLYVTMVAAAHAPITRHREQRLHFVQCRKLPERVRQQWRLDPGNPGA